MSQRILVPLDESDQATAALEYALTQFSGADIIVVHVIETGGAIGIGAGYAAPIMEKPLKQSMRQLKTMLSNCLRRHRITLTSTA